jgi:hypothetical protein
MAFQFALNAIRFEDVRAEIVRFLEENGTYDSQFDFEGSNLSYVIDTMAYTTMLMSYMLSTVANDNFLDTTTLRKNAVSIAKTLGYKPKRVQASRIEGVFTYRPGSTVFTDESKITIPPNTSFTGTDDGYTWVNVDPIILQVNPKDPYEMTSVAETQPRITLIQGIFKQYSVLGTGESLQSFVIPSVQIDENNMKVSVYTTQDAPSSAVEWTHSKTFFDIQGDEIYFVEEDVVNEGQPKIIFGNNIVGRSPSLTETILVDYLETVGEKANNESDVEIPNNVVLNKSFDILTVDSASLEFTPSAPSFSGTPYETLDQIQSNAPRFFAAAGRAVTGNDMETLIENEYGYLVDQVAVFGGDEIEPGNRFYLGQQYIAATPESADTNQDFTENLQIYLTESSESEIISKLRDAGIIATEKYFLKPSYIYLQIDPTIEVSFRISAAERDNTEENAQEVLENYFDTEFNGFGVPYRESKVKSQVDALSQVVSTEIDTDYSFVLNKETFYITQDTRLWLPVIFARNEDGSISRDEQGYPETSNFIKKNDAAIIDANANNLSLIDLFQVTVDNDLVASIYQPTYIWHNRDVNGPLDKYWQATLEDVTYDGVLNFSDYVGSAPILGTEEFNFIFANAIGDQEINVTIPPDDGTSSMREIITSAVATAVNNLDGYDATAYTDTTTANVLINSIYNYSVSDGTSTPPIDGTISGLDATTVFGEAVFSGPASILSANPVKTWEIQFNGTRVAWMYTETDRGTNVLTDSTAVNFLEDIVETRSNFIVTDADPLNGIDYSTIQLRRVYNKYNLLPELIDGSFRGKTAIRGALTHADLDRYLYNNDVFDAKVAELFISTSSGNKGLIQETFQFKGQGSNAYTSSLSFSSVDASGNNTYSLYLNNTVSEERQKVATLIWNKSDSGIEQFDFLTQESEAQWLQSQGFEVITSVDGTNTVYTAFSVTLDDAGIYRVGIVLAAAVSSIKVREKNEMCSFEYAANTDGTSDMFTVEDSKTRIFLDDTFTDVPLTITESSPGTLEVWWKTKHLFDVTQDSTEYTGLKATIIDDAAFRTLGLREEVVVEPLRFTANDLTIKEGFAVYVYGIFHGTVLGSFEYETGDAIFNRIIEGNYKGGASVETALSHIRDYFDNYGTGDDDTKMDIITINPDNEYDTIDGVLTAIGALSDFDSVFTQTVRASILPIKSVLI